MKEKIESGDATLRSSQYGQSVHDSNSEWDAVTVHLDIGRLSHDSERDLGLMLVGGRDNPYYPDDTGVYVAQVAPGSVIDNKLRVNDCILSVNNVDCSAVSTRMIMDTLRSCSTGPAIITIRRRRINRRTLRTTQLPVGSVPHGITLEIGIYIAKISPGSLAAKDGYLAVGDRVLNVSLFVYFLLCNCANIIFVTKTDYNGFYHSCNSLVDFSSNRLVIWIVLNVLFTLLGKSMNSKLEFELQNILLLFTDQ